MNKVLGMLLIAVGLVSLLWGGISYTTSEKLVDIGPIHATREQQHSFPVAPVVGVVAMIGGIVLLVAGRPKLA